MGVRLHHISSAVDETAAETVRSLGTEFKLAFDRELVPDRIIAAFNLIYEPEWTRLIGSNVVERESTAGVAFGLMAQLRPGFLLGGEARYLRKYEGTALEELAGQALFIGPTAYFQLSKRSRLTASWSTQAWGRPTGGIAGLDLVNFERHQARLVFGRLAQAMRDGGAALHPAVDRRAPEMDRGQVALRISAQQPEGFERAGVVRGLRITTYCSL